jgi:hypothetical protein
MSKILLDAELRARLNGLNEEMQVCDEAGRVVGHFLPVDAYRRLLYARLAQECPYSPEELEQMHQQTGGQSLVEFWQGLARS